MLNEGMECGHNFTVCYVDGWQCLQISRLCGDQHSLGTGHQGRYCRPRSRWLGDHDAELLNSKRFALIWNKLVAYVAEFNSKAVPLRLKIWLHTFHHHPWRHRQCGFGRTLMLMFVYTSLRGFYGELKCIINEGLHDECTINCNCSVCVRPSWNKMRLTTNAPHPAWIYLVITVCRLSANSVTPV